METNILSQAEESEDEAMQEDDMETKDKAFLYAKAVKHGSFNAFKALQAHCQQTERKAALAAQAEGRAATYDSSNTTEVQKGKGGGGGVDT